MSRLTSELTVNQIDDWFTIGKSVSKVKTVSRRLRGKTTGRDFDATTGQARVSTDKTFIPSYIRPTGLSRNDYIAAYQQKESQQLIHSINPLQAEDGAVVSQLDQMELESMVSGSVGVPETLLPPNATDVYNNYSFEHEYSTTLPITCCQEQEVNIKEEEIDGSGLNYITDEELKTLIPKIGKRAKFRPQVDNLKKSNLSDDGHAQIRPSQIMEQASLETPGDGPDVSISATGHVRCPPTQIIERASLVTPGDGPDVSISTTGHVRCPPTQNIEKASIETPSDGPDVCVSPTTDRVRCPPTHIYPGPALLSKGAQLTLDAVKDLVKIVGDKKKHIKIRAKACALLKVADVIDRKHLVLLKELHTIYREEYRREYIFSELCTRYGVPLERAELFASMFWNEDSNYHKLKSFDKSETILCMKILKKLPQLEYKSSDARDLFMNHLPVVLVYKLSEKNNTESHIIKRLSGVKWSEMIEKLDWPSKDKLVKEEVVNRIGSLIPKALSYTTEKDRHLLKLILVKLTSTTFLKEKGIHGLCFNDQYTVRDAHLAEQSIANWSSNSEPQKKKSRLTSNRLPGAGRLPLANKYPELANLMLRIFDTGLGLQSHPRLVCETLYLDNHQKYMDMPRCVTILQDIYDIDISLSAAYTYTENFRSKTKQAMRHHEGKGLNPGISLKKSTKDGSAKELSINDHYAQADMNYSLEQAFQNNSVIIARDDKALVHCDVQVVDRPSKSWKRISYADHDWAKDTQRSLQISTYQFVKLKSDIYTDDYIQVGDVSICQTNLTGPGLSIVKIHYFELSTVHRHFNELLYVMSLDKYEDHFKSEDGDIRTQILFTVDGGPDERPRNKSTQFMSTLLKKILDLDKVKTISYAEGSSKRHSVERYHVSEGRALSQQGTISSHGIHEAETNEAGMFDLKKFRENMELAREDCINRIDGIPYAGYKMTALKPPSTKDWVISEEETKLIDNFLSTDTTNHRIENNFVIQPKGPIWEKLCQMYNLHMSKSFNAVSIFNETNDPSSAWQQHYGYTTYRRDHYFKGSMLPLKEHLESGALEKCFEFQPLLDVGRLPEFHYLGYKQCVLIMKYFLDNQLELPDFMRSPDFYLPSRNIEYIRKEKPETLKNDAMVELLSNTVGVQREEILNYVDKNRKKDEQNKGK